MVFLAEDKAHATRLDCLEMQYLREVSTQEALKEHLRQPEGRIRYARSCRDVSSAIPNHRILAHSAIGARAIRDAISKDDASILIWTLDENTLEVKRKTIPVVKSWTSKIGEWTIVSDDCLSKRLAVLRASKLPKETGGVLLGTYDMDRRIVYVVDTIPSPPDSEEWPTVYIRGRSGLQEQVERIQKRTEGQLQYIGEWHSHPNGCACDPSNDDRKVFLWLTENMAAEGLPPLMAIVGDKRRAKWFIGSIEEGAK